MGGILSRKKKEPEPDAAALAAAAMQQQQREMGVENPPPPQPKAKSPEILTIEGGSPAANKPRRRRGSISSEANPQANAQKREKKVIPKSDEAKERIRAAIERNILFKGLDDEQRKDIFDSMFEVRCKPGDTIIKQGDEGDNYYVVDSGTFDIFVAKPGEDPIKVLTVGDGGSFGELALMYNAPRAATVKAVEDGLLWAVDRVTFRAILMDTTARKRNLYEGFLESIPLLAELAKWERLRIADALETESFDAGEAIITQGDAGDKFYIVEEGTCVAMKKGEGEGMADIEAKRYSKGNYFGEIALLTDQPRAASVVAGDGGCKCATLDTNTFHRLLGPLTDILKRNIQTYKSYEQLADGSAPPSARDNNNSDDSNGKANEEEENAQDNEQQQE